MAGALHWTVSVCSALSTKIGPGFAEKLRWAPMNAKSNIYNSYSVKKSAVTAQRGNLYSNEMTDKQPNNPLHGITLEQVVTRLEKRYGWEYLARNININCFKSNPSVKSSLKFLRRTPWARVKVEAFFIVAFSDKAATARVDTAAGPWAKSLAHLNTKG